MSLAPPVEIAPPAPRNRQQPTPEAAASCPRSRNGTAWAWLVFWLACLAAPLPMLVPYLTHLWQQEHYQFFPLVLVTVAILALSRWDGGSRAPGSWLCWCVLLGGWAATGFSVAIFSPWLGIVGFVAIATAWLGSAREADGRSLVVLAVPLLTLIRLPLQTDMLLIIRLQGWTTKIASMLLDVLTIPHLATGNVIELTTRELFVAEACSGIQSVFTLFFLASLLVAYNRHTLWFIPMYWAAAVLLAVLGNSFRVASVAAGESILGVDWATGWSHEVLGYATLTIALLLLMSFDQWFTAFLHPMRDVPNYLGLQNNPLVDLWNWCVGASPGDAVGTITEFQSSPPATTRTRYGWILPIGLTTVCLALGTLTSLAVAHGWTGPGRHQLEEELTIFFTPPQEMLAGVWDEESILEHEVARDGEDRRLGKAADIWTVADRQLNYQVVLSQPYIGWHELCVCYENLDWQLADRSILTSASAAAEDTAEWGSPQFAFARFRRDGGRRGYLLFAAITYDGRGVPPPLGPGIAERLGQRLAFDAYVPQEEMMMVQLWLESPGRLHPDEIQRLKEAFDRTRLRILQTVRNSPEAITAAALNP